jgi:hypothetical protein
MNADDTRDTTRDFEETPAAPSEGSQGPLGQLGAVLGSGLNRRKFLAAAALGSAAAALVTKADGLGGVQLGPLVAFADDLSGLNCSANDVRIVGPGIVVNEQCNCTGTFNAQVRFRIINNTGTQRYCVTVHFCPGTLPGGGTFNPGDVLIGDIPAKSDAFYTVTIPNYPCGAGRVCFGACGPGTDETTGQPDCSFPKNTPCPSGQCCTTISWDVNPGCPDRVITSKCRHQQVCIQGRGGATLDCDTGATGVQTNCNVQCGSTTTVRLCTTEAASFGPFTFVLRVPGQSDQTFGPTNDTCHDFTVGPITGTTTITGDVRSNDGCTKSASVTLTTTAVTAGLAASTPGCDGKITFTASTTGAGSCTYEFFVDGVSKRAASASNTFTYDPCALGTLDGACHTVRVRVVCGGCEASASRQVVQCVNTSVNAAGACP